MPARVLKPGRHGGAFTCAVCALPEDQRDQLNGELAKRVAFLRLEKRWGISRTALRAHKANHFPKALVALRTERIAAGVRKVADRVEEVIVRDDAMYEAARAVANMPLAIKANNSKADHLELLAKITGELDERAQVTVNIQTMPAYVAVRTVIFEVLEPHPELRAEISRRLRVLADSSDTGDASQ